MFHIFPVNLAPIFDRQSNYFANNSDYFTLETFLSSNRPKPYETVHYRSAPNYLNRTMIVINGFVQYVYEMVTETFQ